MIVLVFIALLNGFCISFCRIINGRLAQQSNALNASFWNHMIGFIFLSLLVTFTPETPISDIENAPFLLFSGGIVGALFVALNSYVLPKIGASYTAMLVIAGQLFTGIALDVIYIGTELNQVVGIFFILMSILFSKRGQSITTKKVS